MAEVGLTSGPPLPPPSPEAASNQLVPRRPIQTAGMERFQRLNQALTDVRRVAGALGFGGDGNGNSHPLGGNLRLGEMVGAAGTERGRRVYVNFRRDRQGRDRLPEPRFNRTDELRPSPSALEQPLGEAQVREALALLNVSGQPVLFNGLGPGSLDISSDQSVLSYMRKLNISPIRYRAIVTNLQTATAKLPDAIASRADWQGGQVTYQCDGSRVWAVCQQAGRVLSAFATGSQVCFLNGPPSLSGAPTNVMIAGVPMTWSITAGGSNIYQGNGRCITDVGRTGSTTVEMRENGRVASAGFFAVDGTFVARANYAGALLPNPRAPEGARGDAAPIRAPIAGMLIHVPDTSRLPAAYRAIAERSNGWLPPPRVLLQQTGNGRAAEQALMQFAASLDLETSNAWLTGIFGGTSEQQPWKLMVSNLRFDQRRGAYNGIEGLRAGTGGCMQVADLGVRILRQRGYNAVSLRVEQDHAAAVALQPVNGGFQAILYDSMGVHFRPPVATPAAALMTAWQDDRHGRPSRAEFIDDKMNVGFVSYEELAQRMLGQTAPARLLRQRV